MMTFKRISSLGFLFVFFAASSFAERPSYTAYRLARAPVIDGDLSDWPELPVLFLGQEQHVSSGDWSGPDDCRALIRLGWDDKALYFAVRVIDDEIVQNLPDGEASRIWSEDSIQWSVDINADGGIGYDGNDYEYGFGKTQSGPCVYRWHVSSASLVVGRTKQVPLAVNPSADGKGVIYEAAVPWGQLLHLQPTKHREIGFTIVVQDRDEKKKNVLQWTRGITTGKNPGKFGRLKFSDAAAGAGEAGLLISGKTLLANDPARYSVRTPNFKGAAELDWRLVDHNGKVVDSGSITQRDNADGAFGFQLTPEKYPAGKYALAIRLIPKENGKPLQGRLDIERVSVKQIGELQEKIRRQRQELQALIKTAKENGIETAYAVGAATVSELFEPYTREDLEKNRYPLALRNVKNISSALKRQAEVLKRQMKQGPEKWRIVPRPDLSRIRLQGREFCVGEEPVILVGPLSWLWNIHRDRDTFGKFGINTLRIGMEPAELYDEKGRLKKDIPWWAMRDCIKAAEEQNLAISNTNLLYKQVWDGVQRRGNVGLDDLRREYISYVDMSFQRFGTGHFFMHEIAVEAQRAPARFEPKLHLQAYRDWLRKEYGSIEKYNRICKTSFPGFDQVTFPDDKETNPGRKFDRAVFLQRVVSEQLAWAADVVRKRDPRAAVAGYPSGLMMDDECDFYTAGLDAELDVRGYDFCDADAAGDFVSAKYAMDTMHWMAMFRDLMCGLAPDKAQWDGEYHFVNERRAYPAGWTAAIHFQSYIHGLSGTYCWVWNRNDATDCALLMDAQVCLDYSETALDLRRLAKEIVAFHAATADVAILYSHRSTPYSPVPTRKSYPGAFGPVVSTHLRQMRDVYEGMFFEGTKLTFVTERQVEAGRLKKFKLLIVPAASHVSDEVVEQVRQYAEQGGRVVLVGDCFTHDHRSVPRRGKLSGKGIQAIPAVADDADARKQLAPRLTELKLRPPIQVVSTPDDPPTVEWRYAHDKKTGRELLYLLNVGHDPVRVRLLRDGKGVEGVDRRTGRRVGPDLRMDSLRLHLLELTSSETPRSSP
ncbi:MAG: beta-galactosidase trimerization domain-containing protein [Phycisphaerae bacterium]|nr:beta-galactosidase trimerization domain-containing protein [Phycisphaerae bacterium]